MTDLASRECVPCKGDTPPLKGPELENLSKEIPEWDVVDEHHLTRRFEFSNFKEALAFVNEVGRIAEEQGHHPDITFGWGEARITVFTHKIDGLTESDFVFAAKVDRI
jgi:4a-hydroxytetrahydrobiopterin dehydratase